MSQWTQMGRRLSTSIQSYNIKILSLDDIDCDEDYWYKHVLNFLKEKVPEFGFPDAYYCGDMENGKYYDKGEFKIEIKRFWIIFIFHN